MSNNDGGELLYNPIPIPITTIHNQLIPATVALKEVIRRKKLRTVRCCLCNKFGIVGSGEIQVLRDKNRCNEMYICHPSCELSESKYETKIKSCIVCDTTDDIMSSISEMSICEHCYSNQFNKFINDIEASTIQHEKKQNISKEGIEQHQCVQCLQFFPAIEEEDAMLICLSCSVSNQKQLQFVKNLYNTNDIVVYN